MVQDRPGNIRGEAVQASAMPSSVPTAGRGPQARLSFPGGPAEEESPEQPFEALQKEQLSLTPNVRHPWGALVWHPRPLASL